MRMQLVLRMKLMTRAERVLKQWADLEERATRVYKQLPAERKSAFYQVVYSAILLNHNLNRLYISGKLFQAYRELD